MKTIRAVVGALLALSAILILSTNQASARQDPYTGPIFGDLTITGDSSPGSTLLLTGDGFAPDSVISLLITASATAEMAQEGDATAGPGGSVSVAVEITGDFLGNYTATLKGQTVDGSTLELAGAFVVAPDPEPIPEPTAVATPTEPPAEDTAATADATDTEVAGTTVTDETTDTSAAEGTDSGDTAATEPDSDTEEAAASLPGDDGGSSSGRTVLIWMAALIVLVAGGGLWRRSRAAS